MNRTMAWPQKGWILDRYLQQICSMTAFLALKILDDYFTGPLRRELIGVLSAFGARRCNTNVPHKLTDVAKYLDWIKA